MKKTGKVMSVDIETYSDVDITKAGVYAYAENPAFEILLIAYKIDDGPVNVIETWGGRKPSADFTDALLDPDVVKTAYNANFERTCLARWMGVDMPPEEWRCTMVHAATLGLPGSLAAVGMALGLPEDKLKDKAGAALIQYFCKPCKPTKANGGRTRNLPTDAPEKWQKFIEYNRQDVVTEAEIRGRLSIYPVPDEEQMLWTLDQYMNDNGIRVDMDMVRGILRYDAQYQEKLITEAKELTGLENPNSLSQLKEWFFMTAGLTVESLTKDTIPELMDLLKDFRGGLLIDEETFDKAMRMLRIRQELGKTSTKKYAAMENAVCADGRLRGILQFYGANRTGRWCLTGDHEVLTEDGWIRLDRWEGGKILCWNSTTEALSFQKSEKLCFDYAGEMTTFTGQRICQIATPEHKMAVLAKDGRWEAKQAGDLTTRFTIPFTGKRQPKTPRRSDELRVLVMTQADGHFSDNEILKFHFSKARKTERCKRLLRRVGIPFYVDAWTEKTVNITVQGQNVPLWLRQFKDKTFGYWLLDEDLTVLFDELPEWDAYRAGPNSIQYSSTNEKNVDVIQACALCAGYSATKKVKIRDHKNWSDAYVLDIWLTPGHGTSIRKEQIGSTLMDGKVYCAKTSTGYFPVRRNGKIWITGNSGRNVQIHNLPQNKIPDIDLARALAADGDFDYLSLLFGEAPFVFSQLIRTAFIPSEGNTFVVADFSAIEARVIAWLAGEEWVLEAFRQGKDIYCETASQMYHVPVEKHGRNAHLRQKGKIAVLACIAKGQKVLTDHGLIPIEEVTTDMKLWDGVDWVNHDGVIYKGKRRTIRYGGLEATEDHIVWAEIEGENRPVYFGDAARSGAHLLQSGAGRKTVRVAQDNITGEEIHQRVDTVLRPDGMHQLRNEEMDVSCKHDAGKNKGLPELQPAQSRSQVAGSEVYRGEATVREPERSELPSLRGEGNQVRVPERNGCLPVYDRDPRPSGSGDETGDRQGRQQRKLCSRQSQMGNTERAECEQTDKQEVQVYDILNAGPRHRFTVSGVLVHNCGYQGGVGAMKAMDRSGSIPEEELQGVVDQWRRANPMIVKLWKDYEAAAKAAIQERRTVKRGVRVQATNLSDREYMAGGPVRPYSVREGVYVAFEYKGGNLFVRLPSGRKLCYWDARVEEDDTGREQITYAGVDQATRQWGRRETYGGKLVENVVQATARDCLAETIKRVDAAGYSIVMHIHDEIVCDVPYLDRGNREDLERITGMMAEPVSWAPGLPLRGDGYVTPFYKKD